jgi:ERI1 exoribonuclease 2
VDLKLLYKDLYGRKPTGLNRALRDAALVFEGIEHSGMDDAVNTARLACRMFRMDAR